MDLQIKNIKETEKTHSHNDVYYNGECLGYFMSNKNPNKSYKKWEFTSCSSLISFYAKTKKELLEIIETQLNKEYIILRVSFGMVELNKEKKETKKVFSFATLQQIFFFHKGTSKKLQNEYKTYFDFIRCEVFQNKELFY